MAGLLMLVMTLAACAGGTTSGGGTRLVATSPGAAGSGGTRVWAFSDASVVQPASVYASVLAQNKGDLCKTAEQGSPAVSTAQALATLENVLTTAAGAGSMDRLAQTKVGSDPAQAEAVAAAMIGKADPGGALAALLLAHKQQPMEPRHLENAGVVAVGIGYPQEALALMLEAESLPSTLAPEMGIDYTATMLNNRADALIRLGRYSEAVSLLHTAIGREPLLDEAQRNLAVALTCLGQFDDGGKAMRAGLRRNQFDDFGDPSKGVTYDPSQVYDVSKGEPTALPEVSYPKTLDAAAGAADKFDSEAQARDDQGNQLLSQAESLPSQSPGLYPLTSLRILSIEDAVANVRPTPKIAQLFDTWQADLKTAAGANDKWLADGQKAADDCDMQAGTVAGLECYNKWCTNALPPAHQQWLKSQAQADAALRAWADAYSRFASGLASNLIDPAARQWVLVTEQAWLTQNYALLIGEASAWIGGVRGLDGTCFNQVTDSPAETKDGAQAAAISCSGAVGGANFSLDLELFSINISCEEIGIEAEAPQAEGGLAEAGLFASVSYKFHTGSTTLFCGGYAKTKEIGGLSSSAHAGAYVTWDEQGNVTDVGIRGESSIDQSKGSGSTSISGPEVHYSFVGAADAED